MKMRKILEEIAFWASIGLVLALFFLIFCSVLMLPLTITMLI